MLSHHIEVWGVMNITPDSFSDGILRSVETPSPLLLRRPQHGLDVGAESTNPKALPIDHATERQRLERHLLPLLEHWPRELTLSLDTYQLATIQWLLPQLPQGLSVVWNDVSGKYHDAIALLHQYPELRYVCCHNPAPTRSLSGQHMNYVSSERIERQVREFFLSARADFLRAGVWERTIADPCFGFGKSREQNLALWSELPELMRELAFPAWMWGISRKSFLRTDQEDPRDPSTQVVLDQRAREWIVNALEKLTGVHTIILRTHQVGVLEDLWKNSGYEK